MADSKAKTVTCTCTVCRQSFNWTPGKKIELVVAADHPKTCGRLHCIAKGTWSLGQWQGVVRMAEARQAAGVPLTELDEEAYRRVAAHR